MSTLKMSCLSTNMWKYKPFSTTLEILSKGNLISIPFIELVANWWYTFYYKVPKSNIIKMPWYNVIHWVWNCLLFSKETYLSLTAGIFISTKCISLSAIKVVETTAHRFIYYMKRRRPDIKMTCRYVITWYTIWKCSACVF